MDHLGTLNDETPRIKVGPDAPISPDVIFGLDTTLWGKANGEGKEWEGLAGAGAASGDGTANWHGDEVETATVWLGGVKPGAKSGISGKGGGCGHDHPDGEPCGRDQDEGLDEVGGEVAPLDRETLERELGKLSFEIYRGEYDYSTYRSPGDRKLGNE